MSNPPKVLVIDDDQLVLDALADLLKMEGYEVAGFASPLKAFDRLQTREYDAALIDLGMAEMNGRTVLRRLHAMDEDLPCIVLTGDATTETAQDCIRLGATEVVVKPFNMAKLRGPLRHAVDVRRLRRG